MRKLYKKYLNISDDNNVIKKSFSTRKITCSLSILICTILICSNTFAYFTDTVSSTGNEIRSKDTFEKDTAQELLNEQSKDDIVSNQEYDNSLNPVEKDETEDKENNESDNVSDEPSKDDITSTQEPDITVDSVDKTENKDNDRDDVSEITDESMQKSQSQQKSDLDTEKTNKNIEE